MTDQDHVAEAIGALIHAARVAGPYDTSSAALELSMRNAKVKLLSEIERLRVENYWFRNWFTDAEDAIEQHSPTFEEVKWRAEAERGERSRAQEAEYSLTNRNNYNIERATKYHSEWQGVRAALAAAVEALDALGKEMVVECSKCNALYIRHRLESEVAGLKATLEGK